MKSPRDIEKEKHGEQVTTPPGGRARARQEQFEEARGIKPAAPKKPQKTPRGRTS